MKRNTKNGRVCRPLAEIDAERRERDRKVIDLHLAGWTQTEIAAVCGVGQSTVNYVLARHRLRPRERMGKV